MNFLILAKSPYQYKSGYYHADWIDALKKNNNCLVWGKGFKGYFKNATMQQVINYALNFLEKIDLIFVTTTWDSMEIDYAPSDYISYDPEPTIKLNETNIPKVYFLNKEYRSLQEKVNYINDSKVDIVVSVIDEIKNNININAEFLHLPFAIEEKRLFQSNKLFKKKQKKKYDFGFTGALHESHTDERYLVKKKLFGDKKLKSFIGSRKIKGNSLKLYWAEWGAKSFFTRKSLLPFGDEYFKLLSSCRSFLSTPSALGIIGTRFYELMALGTLCICPEATLNHTSGRKICRDLETCILYGETTRDFFEVLEIITNEKKLIKRITENARDEVLKYNTYEMRILNLINFIKEKKLIN